MENSVVNLVVESGIELRILDASDAAALDSLKDGYTSYQNEWLYRGTADDFIESSRAEYRRSGSLTFGIFERGSLAGILICAVDARKKSLSVDYGLGNRYRGRGLVTRAIARVLGHFFADRGFLEACISIDPENHKSVAVAERLGFRAIETIRGVVDYGNAQGDLRRYRLTSSEWHAP